MKGRAFGETKDAVSVRTLRVMIGSVVYSPSVNPMPSSGPIESLARGPMPGTAAGVVVIAVIISLWKSVMPEAIPPEPMTNTSCTFLLVDQFLVVVSQRYGYLPSVSTAFLSVHNEEQMVVEDRQGI